MGAILLIDSVAVLFRHLIRTLKITKILEGMEKKPQKAEVLVKVVQLIYSGPRRNKSYY